MLVSWPLLKERMEEFGFLFEWALLVPCLVCPFGLCLSLCLSLVLVCPFGLCLSLCLSLVWFVRLGFACPFACPLFGLSVWASAFVAQLLSSKFVLFATLWDVSIHLQGYLSSRITPGERSLVRIPAGAAGTSFSVVNFLCWLLFRYVFSPRVTAVACKRSWSFC